ncbi:MAG: hypothetical protein IJH65_13795 [Methanobrevibacter sp.]|nr:hypothetical protein [Methanobrevibacter sp.]
MDSVKITLDIVDRIEEVLDLGYARLYVNVDDLENGNGFLRVLAMQGPKDIIVYEGRFALDVCGQVLKLLERSKYEMTNFTTGGDDL